MSAWEINHCTISMAPDALADATMEFSRRPVANGVHHDLSKSGKVVANS